MDSKLVGHLLLVLKAEDCRSAQSLVGQQCVFHGKGHQTVLKTEEGVILTPLTTEHGQHSEQGTGTEGQIPEAAAETQLDDSAALLPNGTGVSPKRPAKLADIRLPQGSAKKARVGGLKSPGSAKGSGALRSRGQKSSGKSGGRAPQKASEGLLQHLQTLAAKERLHVPACIADVLTASDGATLVLVSVDVYFPFAIWEGRREWRGSASAIAVLSHMSCDWAARAKVLEGVEERAGLAGNGFSVNELREAVGTEARKRAEELPEAVDEKAGLDVNRPVGVSPAVKERELAADQERAKLLSKGKWKVDDWSEVPQEGAPPLDKPPGALVIREPAANHALTQRSAAGLLSSHLGGGTISLQGVQKVVGECQVLGCKLHRATPPEEKKARFNLPTLFRSLPSHLDELDGLLGRTATYMLPGGEQAGTGLCDIPDEVLILIMARLESKDLQRMEAVCKHTRALGAALFPSINLPLFQHQRAAARWMIERERNAGSMFNPLFRRLTSEDGFVLYANLVTGEVSSEEPPPVVDGKGGMICDEPGMGKTATSLALIMKTLGTRAVGPSKYPTWFVEFEGMADGQAGYYVLPGDATGGKSGSAVRRRRSLYANFAPSTPQNELPRGRLMSDLKAVSEPNPGKLEERDSKAVSEPNPGKLEERERAALEGVRRNLFGGGENRVGEGTSTGGPRSSENGGGRLEEKSLSKGLSLKSVTAAGEEGWGCALQSGQEARIEPLATMKESTAHLAAYGGSADNRFAFNQGAQIPAVLSPLKLGPHTPSLDSKGQRKMRFLSEIEHTETVAKRRKTERTFEGGFGVDKGFEVVPSLETVVKDGARGWQPDGVDEGFKGVRSSDNVVKDGVRHEVGGWQSDGVDEGFKGVRSLKDVVKGGVRQEVEGWQSDGVDAGFKAVRSLDDVVKTAVKNGLGYGDKPQLEEWESFSAKTSVYKRSGFERSGFNEMKRGVLKEGGCGESNELIAGGMVESKAAIRATLEKSIAEIRRQLRGLDEPQEKTADQYARLSDEVITVKHSGVLADSGKNEERVGNPSEGGGELQGMDGSSESDRFSHVFNEDGADKQEGGGQDRVELRHVQSAEQLSHRENGPEQTSPVEDNSTQLMTESLSMPTAGRAERADSEADSDSFISYDPLREKMEMEELRSRKQAPPSSHNQEAVRQILEPSPTPQPRKASRPVRIDRTALPATSGGKLGANPDPVKVTKLSFVYRPGSRTLEAQSQEGPSESAAVERAGSEKEEEEQGTDSHWVECEACHKWRRLPPGCAKPPEDSAWFCSMNKDPLRQDCNAPSEELVENEWSSSHPGFTAPGEEPGSAENVAYFLENLRAQLPALQSAWRATRWLSELKDADLNRLSESGLLVPWMRRDPDYSTVFSALGLEQCILNDPFSDGPYSSAHGARRRLTALEKQMLKKAEEQRARSHRWRYPRHIRPGWAFDTAALREALSTPVEDAMRIYLSKATLVVVPSNLIQHWLFQIKKHTPSEQLKVHVWDGQDARSPSAHKLAWNYDIVLTTFNRLSAEWANKNESTLLQVHWLRIMLDEGHTLGASLQMTNKLQMTIALRADRRWVLTGTPTPNTPNSQVAHLHPLLKFLHEGCYGEQQKTWEAAIQRPFEAQREEGRQRLEELLHRTMISATKQDMKSIPNCHRKLVMLDFTPAHAKSYNELVGTVRRNLLLADWNDPNHVESLLNPKQWKLARDTVTNVRKSCCVAGNMMIEDTPGEIDETMEALGIDPPRFDVVRSALKSGGQCDRCSVWSRLPIVTPCAHLLCISCVSLNGTQCTMPGCFKPYQMQQKGRRPENPDPRGPVPQDLIELQPSYAQAVWNPDWQSTQSSKLAYLKRCLQEMVAQNNALLKGPVSGGEMQSPGQGDVTLGPASTADGASASWQTAVPRQAPMTWTRGPDSQASTSGLPVDPQRQPEKAIVFSEFLEYLMLVEDQLAAAGIQSAPMYSPKTHSMKMQALARFQNDPSCCVLVMDGSAAVGLDLSFVSRVYLMEPIWDKSLEEQVVSRAWRMGATRPVMVETLAMRGTIEEEMVHVLHSQEDHSGKSHREAQELNARISCLSCLMPVGLPQ